MRLLYEVKRFKEFEQSPTRFIMGWYTKGTDMATVGPRAQPGLHSQQCDDEWPCMLATPSHAIESVLGLVSTPGPPKFISLRRLITAGSAIIKRHTSLKTMSYIFDFLKKYWTLGVTGSLTFFQHVLQLAEAYNSNIHTALQCRQTSKDFAKQVCYWAVNR